MGTTTEVPSDPKDTLELLSEEISDLKTSTEKKFSDMQKQLDSLRGKLDSASAQTDKRLKRITALIDNSMDSFEQIMILLTKITETFAITDGKIAKVGSSAATNKHNLSELSKYVKHMNKMWTAAQEEIEKLKASDEENVRFRWKMGVGFSIAAGIIILILKGNWFDSLMDILFGK